MKYITDERFLVSSNSKEAIQNYADNYDRIFGKTEEAPPADHVPVHPPFPDKCESCGRPIDDSNINWCAPRDPYCVGCCNNFGAVE